MAATEERPAVEANVRTTSRAVAAGIFLAGMCAGAGSSVVLGGFYTGAIILTVGVCVLVGLGLSAKKE